MVTGILPETVFRAVNELSERDVLARSGMLPFEIVGGHERLAHRWAERIDSSVRRGLGELQSASVGVVLVCV
jgi:hypothetical protein